MISKRAFVGSLAMTAGAWTVGARAQSKVIRIIHPFAPGGAVDAVARFLADQMAVALGETVIVENRVGADGRIGTRYAIDAPPDGRTLLFTPFAPIAIHPVVYASLPYDPLADLAPVSQVATSESSLCTGPMTNARNLQELVNWLRANPNSAAFGSPATGSVPYFVGVIFGKGANIDLQHVPYRGTAPLMNDLVAGQIALASIAAGDATPMHQAGKLRMLAISSGKRRQETPEVPTLQELGVDLVANTWDAMYAPAKTPPEVIEKISKVVIEIVRGPKARELFARLGRTPVGSTAVELKTIQENDFQYWKKKIDALGFKMSD